MDDVYAGLTELLRPAERGQAPGGWLFGQVQQAGQGTLRVVCGGLTLDQTELHVPPGLDYAWTGLQPSRHSFFTIEVVEK